MSKLTIADLLDGTGSNINTSNCIIGRFWRLTLYNIQIDSPSWDRFLQRYTDKCSRLAEAGDKSFSNLKGNLPKALAKDEVTFKALCRGLRVLYPEFEIAIKVFSEQKEETYRLTISAVYTDDESPGKGLKAIWEIIKGDYMDEEKWQESLAVFRDKYRDVYGVDASNLITNLTRALVDSTITWNVFYQGLMVCGIHNIELLLIVGDKEITKVTANCT